MKKEYLISILGIQEVDGEKNEVEVITSGHFMTKNGHTYIGYKEYDDEDPKVYSDNLIKIESPEKVTIIRKGDTSSRLILEKGKRHQCFYNTIAGDLMIGIFTDAVESNLHESGGKLYVKYSIDFNNDLVSSNEFKIDIKQKEE